MQSDFYLGYPLKSRRSDMSLSLWLKQAVAWSECGSLKFRTVWFIVWNFFGRLATATTKKKNEYNTMNAEY